MKLRLLVLAVLTAVSLRAAEALPVFNALMTMGSDHRFVLVSPGGQASSWLKLGASFEGYKLKAYDTASGGLDLERDGKVTRVMIVADAAVKSSGPAALPATPATIADADDVLKTMHFEEMMAKIMEQQKKAMGPMMKQMAAQMKVPEDQRARFSEFQQKVMDEAMSAVTGPEMRGDVARIYSEVFSKEELTGMSAFYGTPSGQAMVDKQPQVQEKMMQVMMPKMMQIGPKMQQMARDFAAEMAAKQQAAPAPAPAPTPTPVEPSK